MTAMCDIEGCGSIASVAISVPGVIPAACEVFFCQQCYDDARPAMEASRSRWHELMGQGCHERIAARRVAIEAKNR